MNEITCYNSDIIYHYHHRFNKNKHGFTLAEVLITLGIIGVVAALTMPGMIINHQKKVVAESVKKAYSELNQVLYMAQNDHGMISDWKYRKADELDKWVQTYIIPYINVVDHKACTTNERCFGLSLPFPLKYEKPGSVNSTVGQYVVTKPGIPMAYAFFRYGGTYENVTRVRVYVKNPKPYAFIGKDVFTFVLNRSTDTSFKPFGLAGTIPFTANTQLDREKLLHGPIRTGGCFKDSGGPDYYGPGDACGAVIMLDGWKIKEDYPW